MLGLGLLGLVTLILGVFPGGLRWGLWVLPGLLVLGAATALRTWTKGAPRHLGAEGVAAALLAGIFGTIPLVAALAPSDPRDWDSLAYQLAVPKLWLAEGQIGFVQNIHHSNFPFTWNNLYVSGLWWGGEAGAKAFNVVAFVLGSAFVFGAVRRKYGGTAAPYGVLGFAGVPVILWGAGTAYVDLAHGLFAAIALLYTVETLVATESTGPSPWLLPGLGLGLCLGTKHTGLQVAVAIAAFLVWSLWRWNRGSADRPVRAALLAAIVALAVAAPWYAKSAFYTGNPVYPFFYSVFGGREWDGWRAQTYSHEQSTFGVGKSPSGIGHAVLGLGYQPGRYVNPGQTLGLGFPTGSIGFAGLVAALVWAASGLRGRSDRRFESAMLGCVGLIFLSWFLLSQQSRYLAIAAVPLAIVGAGAVSRLSFGRVLATLLGAQAVYTFFLLVTQQTLGQIPVVLGREDRNEYRLRTIPFARAAQVINTSGPGGEPLIPTGRRIVLYDEVFGFLLDCNYVWGNPGHSTWIPYERLESGEDLVDALTERAITHAYVNLDPGLVDRGFGDRWLGASGLVPGAEPYLVTERETMRRDPNLWWRWLLADSIRSGRARPIQVFGSVGARPRALLFELTR